MRHTHVADTSRGERGCRRGDHARLFVDVRVLPRAPPAVLAGHVPAQSVLAVLVARPAAVTAAEHVGAPEVHLRHAREAERAVLSEVPVDAVGFVRLVVHRRPEYLVARADRTDRDAAVAAARSDEDVRRRRRLRVWGCVGVGG